MNSMSEYRELRGDLGCQVWIVYRADMPVQVEWAAGRREMYEARGKIVKVWTTSEYAAFLKSRRDAYRQAS
ncbi:MAG TPA: hypothetical protein VM243_02160 [Phycisphaerae bacterium]|nr:hypothetical protein [Phycisphaerae bacterium]